LKQAEYSLEMIRELSTQTVYTTTTESTNYTVNDKLAFFVDSFFAFLYSTFDITSQVVNQKLRLKIDEKQVIFKEVNKKLTNKHSGKPTQRVYKTLSNSRKFKRLHKYRNCSTHRREICIKEGVQIESVTPCYSSSGPLMAVKRLICDDPYSLNPSFDENHELVKYTSDMLQWVNSQIFVILRSM
jgi:hypothetical protein